MRRSSTAENLTLFSNTRTDRSLSSGNSGRRLTRNKSMISSIEALDKKRDDSKSTNSKVADDHMNTSPSNETLKTNTKNKIEDQSIYNTTLAVVEE
jgi:hypothetical protein